MKQIQFGVYSISDDAEYNASVRAELESPLNNGWDLRDWQIVERGLDEENKPVIFIAVCLTRTLEETVKRGRPSKVEDA